MPRRQSLAQGWSKMASERFSAFMELCMSYIVICSTPAPIPISIYPALILAAMSAQASRPEEQNLLMAKRVVVSGKPARKEAILLVMAPDPG